MAPPHLTDEEHRPTGYRVIDFEATPTGHRPEPVNVAALALRVRDGQLAETSRLTALTRPPAPAPITRFATEQTGITAETLAGQPDAGTVLANLDARLDQPPYPLVAHNTAPGQPPRSGDVVIISRAASVQFTTSFLLRVIRVLPWETYAGWCWLDGYVLDTVGDAVGRRRLFVQIHGLRRPDPGATINRPRRAPPPDAAPATGCRHEAGPAKDEVRAP
jgi:hypothetical protein